MLGINRRFSRHRCMVSFGTFSLLIGIFWVLSVVGGLPSREAELESDRVSSSQSTPMTRSFRLIPPLASSRSPLPKGWRMFFQIPSEQQHSKSEIGGEPVVNIVVRFLSCGKETRIIGVTVSMTLASASPRSSSTVRTYPFSFVSTMTYSCICLQYQWLYHLERISVTTGSFRKISATRSPPRARKIPLAKVSE